jgi:AbrB family looped-hinge helix DNA binding protein
VVRVDQQGRILVPKELREAVGMRPGGNLTLLVEGGEIRIITPQGARQRMRELSAKYSTGNRSLVDELIAERRAEAERE